MSEPKLHVLLHPFKYIENGTNIQRGHLLAFVGLTCLYSFLISHTVPIQSTKVSFLVITVHFFLNFFFAFHSKIELETIKSHHYSLIAFFCVGAFCLFGVAPSGWMFICLNIPFFANLFTQFASSSDKLWTLMQFGLNLIVIVLFFFYSIPGQESPECVFAKKYWAWSLLALTASLIWAYSGFNHARENVNHLGNLINFISIAYFPFLFVLQKNDPVPMYNVFGYLCLVPTILVGVVLLSLVYYFVSNFKTPNVLAFINLCSLFYLFVHVNIYSSALIRFVFLAIIVLMFAKIPIMMTKYLIDSFEENEINEDVVESEDQTNRSEDNNSKKSADSGSSAN